MPVVLRGIEASPRRPPPYDYWQDKVRPSILCDSGADMIIYGMGEKPIVELSRQLDEGIPVSAIHDIPQTTYLATSD